MVASISDPAGGAHPGAAKPRELLDGIELVVFDKDGTLIDFQFMWTGWLAAFSEGLERETGVPFGADLENLMGVDPTNGAILPNGLLAATPMAMIRERVVDLLVGRGQGIDVAERAVAAVWHAPDPVALARPVTDLAALLASLRLRDHRLAIATTDDRAPTERTLAALGIAGLVDAVCCADDGKPVKPAPDAVLTLCAALGVPPARTAVVGDAPADLRMGRSAGAGRVIGVLSGVGDAATLQPLADVVIQSVADLAPVDWTS